MSDKTFFDEETVEKVREHDKTAYAESKRKESFNKINTVSQSYNEYNYANEELLKAFVDKNYLKIMKNKFNIWAFLFGPLYYLYRKMYIHGFLLTLFMSIVNSYFFNIEKTIVVCIGFLSFDILLAVAMGISFNRMYIGYCINNIQRYKKEYPTLNTIDICRKEGGTSVILALVFGFIIIGLVNFIMTLF